MPTLNELLIDLVGRQQELEVRLSKPSIDSVWDYCLGRVQEGHFLGDPFELFRVWLTVQLGIAAPSSARGGMWIGGEAMNWRRMISDKCDNDIASFHSFFELLKSFVNDGQCTVAYLDVPSDHTHSFLLRDYGDGLPAKLEIVKYHLQTGSYLLAAYTQDRSKVLGYYSTEKELIQHVNHTTGLSQWERVHAPR